MRRQNSKTWDEKTLIRLSSDLAAGYGYGVIKQAPTRQGSDAWSTEAFLTMSRAKAQAYLPGL
ncbi:MAG TPA: hypothetical protein IGS53_13550 [Leptolyngbyaceae cyanobacterium M33_DOE_097]|uniref:Uncharacterized protein n=1 Tax=Oscillatoriales cyanobacterium SpSt-418 TaxID=2282169 RepID=A0A7C3KE37_9CYAN|nr:hypothetical protein [Leptolyngbyaceae cyanobacterium M33_DOE_097]